MSPTFPRARSKKSIKNQILPDYLLPRVFIIIKCCIFSEDYQSLSLIRLLLELTFFSVSRERAGLRLTQMLLQLQVLLTLR